MMPWHLQVEASGSTSSDEAKLKVCALVSPASVARALVRLS